MTTKQEILKDKLTVYLAAGKQGKTEILGQLEAIVHMHRQALVRRLNQLAKRKLGWQKKHLGRKEVYGPQVTIALKELWFLTSHICAERLHPQIPELVSVLQRFKDWQYPPRLHHCLNSSACW